MQQIAFVTGADRGLGLALTAGLLDQGWRVFAGQYMPDWPELGALTGRFPDALSIVPLDVGSADSAQAAARAVAAQAGRLDMLVNNAGVNSPTSPRGIREQLDYDEMRRLYETNTLGPLRVAEAFLPLVEAGELRRLCFVSSEAGSIGAAQRTSWYGYCMSKAALNMAVRIMFNDLRPAGFTFRVYHPGWVRSYIGGAKNMEADLEPEVAAAPALAYFTQTRDDEDRLVLRDWRGQEWPW
jgi:NAD(P)-dependent dehydrogenase (short-subunit alcohol dehydrogenase family)